MTGWIESVKWDSKCGLINENNTWKPDTGIIVSV